MVWLSHNNKTPCTARGYKRGGATQLKYESFWGDGLWICGGGKLLNYKAFNLL